MVSSATGQPAAGVHTFEAEGVVVRYHVHGSGPVCVAHPGGPGIDWEYLRAPELEKHLTMVYLEPAGTGGSDRLATHPHGYTRRLYSRHLAALIDRLAVGPVHVLGHSHGGFVAQYHALHHPDQVAGLILYESAPLTGPEHMAEAQRLVGEFAARHADQPDLPAVLQAFAGIPAIADDESMERTVRGILPAYVADYWADAPRWARLQAALRANHISGLDEHGSPDLIDDRAALAALSAPTLIVVGRHDVICGVRWAEELHRLIPASRLLILERSGHLGHLEEPERFAAEVTAFASAQPGLR
ncbi:alpha/beta fold hydrolase [Nonomuraea sp. JJY05]|uniref:alpha/beta fold hydrolase n=1 Tax=Nonomuraea sp. JJY05 TaxID=3350255 RepID=UPI00373F38FE